MDKINAQHLIEMLVNAGVENCKIQMEKKAKLRTEFGFVDDYVYLSGPAGNLYFCVHNHNHWRKALYSVIFIKKTKFGNREQKIVVDSNSSLVVRKYITSIPLIDKIATAFDPLLFSNHTCGYNSITQRAVTANLLETAKCEKVVSIVNGKISDAVDDPAKDVWFNVVCSIPKNKTKLIGLLVRYNSDGQVVYLPVRQAKIIAADDDPVFFDYTKLTTADGELVRMAVEEFARR